MQAAGEVVTGRAPPPSTIEPSAPKAFDPVIMRALEKHRDERWKSAEAFRDALLSLPIEPWDAEQIAAFMAAELPREAELERRRARMVEPDAR